MPSLPRSRRAIRFENGCWWLCGPRPDEKARICGVIDNCGWRVASLCAQLKIPRRSFERLVMESLGIPAKQWLLHLRAVRAGHFLREGRRIKEVAHELNFRHRTDFTREFTRFTGVTPSNFQAAEARRAGGGELE
ncbi:MAG: helix-turn-helix domain-containing protein [Akkermansiaceae bacterium]|nr:helix-turn-helix domain-containing protein [Akkermansiaceae bacterium]